MVCIPAKKPITAAILSRGEIIGIVRDILPAASTVKIKRIWWDGDPQHRAVTLTGRNVSTTITTIKAGESNIDGIFAIGDLRDKYARQIVLSAADGCTAALAAAHYVEIKRAGEA